MPLIASEIIADELRDSGLLKAGTGMSSKQRTQIFKSGSRIYYTSSIFFPPQSGGRSRFSMPSSGSRMIM
jgi:hypothetical protein